MKTELKHLEKYYYNHEYPKVQKALQEFRKEHVSKLKDKRIPNLLEHIEIYQFIVNHCNEALKSTEVFLPEKRVIEQRKKKFQRMIEGWKAEIREIESYESGKEKPDQPQITDLDIYQAKEYPISNLLEVNRHNKTNCIFHDDQNPSMHYYESTNTVYCFSCQKSADAIDVYQELHKCEFPEAVLKLTNKP